jgi:uncharacterized protein
MFPCTMCGCCCRRIGDIIKQGIEFPYKAMSDGACEMLEDNKCKIYDSRPTICNIDKLAKILHIERKEFYKENIKACNQMMDDDNIPQEFRIR